MKLMNPEGLMIEMIRQGHAVSSITSEIKD